MSSFLARCVEAGGTVLPADFVRGILGKMGQARAGRPAFLLGAWSDGGWWYYQPLVLLFKTSTVVQVLSLLCVGLVLSGRLRWRIEEARAALPAALLLGWLCLSSRINIGARHVVFVLPVAYILLSGLVPWSSSAVATKWGRAVLGVVVVALAATNLSVYPHYLAYFCRAVGGPARGYKVAIDSNLDWGQDDGRVADWGRQHKVPVRANADPFVPQTGYVALSANCYQGLFHREAAPNGRRAWDWLKRFKPVDRIGYTWFVYHVEADDYRTFAEAHPSDASAWLDYAIVQMRNNQYRPASEALRRADVLGPALKAAVLYRQGQLALATGEPTVAVRCLSDATTLAPADDDMKSYLAVAKAAVALGNLERAGRKDPADPEVLANILVMIREYALLHEYSACQRYLQLLENAGLDGNGQYWAYRGYVYGSTGKIDLAVRCLKRAAELVPDDKEVLDLLADLQHLQRLSTSDSARDHYQAGQRFEDLQLYRQAMEQYLQAHERDPAAADPMWAMGELQIGRRLGSTPFDWP
jgi:tetratricopeptide (TPR) repeat protein